jgi:hypothetical protein
LLALPTTPSSWLSMAVSDTTPPSPPFWKKRAKPKRTPEALSPDVSVSCVLNCAEVLASAACIGVGIAEDNVGAVKACGKFGLSKVSLVLPPLLYLDANDGMM